MAIQLGQFAAGFVIRQTAKQSLGSFVVHSSLHGRVDLVPDRGRDQSKSQNAVWAIAV